MGSLTPGLMSGSLAECRQPATGDRSGPAIKKGKQDMIQFSVRSAEGRGASTISLAIAAACFFALALGARQAGASPAYDDGGEGCVTCHTGFNGGPQGGLHVQHTSKFGISTSSQCADLCHPSGSGSTPVLTYTSNNGAGLGCAGCHGRDYGEISPNSGNPKASAYGLRQFHANKGVTSCQSCHAAGLNGHSDPLPPIEPENVRPPYYISPLMRDPCSSDQEAMNFIDGDSVGLDNDGNGFADWPADLNCAQPTTTTTTSTTTSTTLPVACGATPAAGCLLPEKASLFSSEKSAGKEKLKVSLKKLVDAVAQSDFGDPVNGSTSYAVCIYDEMNQLVGEMSVARAGQNCGKKPCFGAVSTKGYKFGDKSGTSDGITKMSMGGGAAGKGKLSVGGGNNAAKGVNSLPTGIAAALQSNSSARVQILTRDAACFEGVLTQVKTADGEQFKAAGP